MNEFGGGLTGFRQTIECWVCGDSEPAKSI